MMCDERKPLDQIFFVLDVMIDDDNRRASKEVSKRGDRE